MDPNLASRFPTTLTWLHELNRTDMLDGKPGYPTCYTLLRVVGSPRSETHEAACYHGPNP